MIDFTPILRHHFVRQAKRMDAWHDNAPAVQAAQLRSLLRMAADTIYGRRYRFSELALCAGDTELVRRYREIVPIVEYEDIRPMVMRMLRGESDVLWSGVCRNYAQSSGTSGGKSKYIPITRRALSHNHYAGASDAVAAYLRLVPRSKLFSGKALILGGSFANELDPGLVGVGMSVGDLSATLIDKVNSLVNLLRVPSKDVALMADWESKLDAIIRASAGENITNLSGVPSWFLVLLRRLMESKGVDNLHDIWPDLEVFFHGGISFRPYRAQYENITDSTKMHFLENYNASEGFFAVQTDFASDAMTLLLDRDVYFEFAPRSVDGSGWDDAVGIADLQLGKIYSLIVTSSAGLWRYAIGDTVEVVSTYPPAIRISGRTRSFINAFGEELMEHNAETALAAACRFTGASVANYTAAPLYAEDGRKGRHQWLVEWIHAPESFDEFAAVLDKELQKVNSDYQAKRAGDIFLDVPQVLKAERGLFDRWLSVSGNCKLGGQRKVPRLCNDRSIIDKMLQLNG